MYPRNTFGLNNTITHATVGRFGDSGIVTSQLSNELSYNHVLVYVACWPNSTQGVCVVFVLHLCVKLEQFVRCNLHPVGVRVRAHRARRRVRARGQLARQLWLHGTKGLSVRQELAP